MTGQDFLSFLKKKKKKIARTKKSRKGDRKQRPWWEVEKEKGPANEKAGVKWVLKSVEVGVEVGKQSLKVL